MVIIRDTLHSILIQLNTRDTLLSIVIQVFRYRVPCNRYIRASDCTARSEFKNNLQSMPHISIHDTHPSIYTAASILTASG